MASIVSLSFDNSFPLLSSSLRYIIFLWYNSERILAITSGVFQRPLFGKFRDSRMTSYSGCLMSWPKTDLYGWTRPYPYASELFIVYLASGDLVTHDAFWQCSTSAGVRRLGSLSHSRNFCHLSYTKNWSAPLMALNGTLVSWCSWTTVTGYHVRIKQAENFQNLVQELLSIISLKDERVPNYLENRRHVPASLLEWARSTKDA